MANGVAVFAYAIWAVLVGASVSLQLCNGIVLNSRDPSKSSYHGFYVTVLAVAIGGSLLLPRAVCSPKPYRRPNPWWRATGGLCSITLFPVIPAGAIFGTSVVLMAQLMGMLSTSLAFDLQSGEMKVTNITRWLGLAMVFLGSILEKALSMRGGVASEWTATSITLLVLVFGSGVCMALQAKLNGFLIQDVGSVARSTAIGSVICCFASIPILLYIWYGLGVPFAARLQDWPFWLYGGFQSAFYIGSLAMIPKKLGFTLSYLSLLAGKLGTSCLIDAVGLTGTQVPFSWLKAGCMLLVLVGATVFSAKPASHERKDAGISAAASLDGSFLQPPEESKQDMDVAQAAQGQYGSFQQP